MVGTCFLLIVMPSSFPSYDWLNFLGGAVEVFMRGSRLDPNARENDCMGRSVGTGCLSVWLCFVRLRLFGLECGLKCR